MFSKEEILNEVVKLQYFYGLKFEIRYAENRKDSTESVAEHIYGMHVLANYFMELENPSHTWDRARIFEMITWHDMDELETGDMLGYMKTDADRAREAIAMQTVIEKVPTVIKDHIKLVAMEYEEQKTDESRFVKALDKIEPLFHLYNNEDGKEVLLRNKTTLEHSRKIKDAYVAAFPYMKEFNDVINTTMQEEGFFATAA